MEAEHRTAPAFPAVWGRGAAALFAAELFPAQEWEAVAAAGGTEAQVPAGSSADPGGRRIPDGDVLQSTGQAAAAGLTRAEALAVLLYTGPMVGLSASPLVCCPNSLRISPATSCEFL